VIGDILDISKIEAGKMQIEPTRCSLAQIVAEVVALMRPQAAAKQLQLNTELAPSIPKTVSPMYCDSARCWSMWSATPSSSRSKARSALPSGSVPTALARAYASM